MMQAELILNKILTDNVGILRFRLDEPLNFTPGQFCNITVDEKTRPYSMTSLPGEEVEFYIKSYPDGDVAHRILDLDHGETAILSPPLGNFRLRGETDTIYLIGGGSGVAPLVSMARHLQDTSTNVVFLHGASHVSELGYDDTLRDAAGSETFSYAPTISRPEVNPAWNGRTGRVEEHLDICQKSDAEVYVCGPPPMVQNVVDELNDNGFDNVYTEQYY